ncbi:hypothetical protein A1O7_02243 [Cladophialophora yegresii CBS 114405]|uniref:Histone-lysine N-methyltransferase SUV39H n=1 Tax=Cladophialophora yegresii CBS 114405 TaxID=1182544 RepID=W9W1G7_9EURO|nr:uncharacterized protein A1O7_02243 [Cladophialophora yegresii CBS 114405]EXJ61813.1 hypothetical protein A1O7_02243 [Cladophialophora yegresii CBS 114405]
MAVAGPMMPAKRRLEETQHDNLLPSVPPSKRHKSRTPAENGARSNSPSRVKLENAKTNRVPAPPAAGSRTARPDRSLFTAVQKKLNGDSRRVSSRSAVDVLDFTGDSSPSPSVSRSSSALPTRNAKPSTTPGSPLFEKVQEVRQSNSYRSPFVGPVQSGSRWRQRDGGHSKLSSGILSNGGAVDRKREGINRPASVQKPHSSIHPAYTSIEKSTRSANVSIEVPRKTTPEPRRSSQHSHIVVEVNTSPRNILQHFQGPLPKSRAEREAERKRLFTQLKHSTQLVQESPALVEQYFGQTGYSKAFSVENEEEQAFMRRAASKKKRRVNRRDIRLEVESLTQSVEGLRLNTKLIHPSRTARDILTSRFDEQVTPPLTFSNDVNDKRLHGKFQFINQYILGEKVRPAPASTNRGCKCTDCSLSSCVCFTKVRTYTRRPDGIVVLSDECIEREIEPDGPHYEITECNEFCRCARNCLNRVVSKGRTVPLEIFQTQKYGFGVRSSQDIVKGQFIELYLGEVITEAELARREEAENDDDPAYIYSLDWFAKMSNSTTYHVDGKYFGSAMRFVNHSCNPNARCFTVQTHKEDRKLYYLAFFAIRDIPAGTEILIDYLGEGALEAESQEEANADSLAAYGQESDDLVKCQCGEKNCRGILWKPGVKARRRRRNRE